MTDNEKLHALIQRVFGELGGRADDAQVLTAVKVSMSRGERDAALDGYLLTHISQALRVKVGELALAQKINGTWTQLSLMSVDDHRHVARAHNKLSTSHRRIAQRYVKHCLDMHGVDISDELAVAS